METPESNGRRDGTPRDTSNTGPEGSGRVRLVRISRLAVAACVLAVVSLLLLPGLIPVLRKTTPNHIREAYSYTTLITALCAAVLGLVSLSRISLHRGCLVGKGFAWMGVMAPVVQWLLFLLVILPALPRSRAFRMTCGANLSGLGKAVLIYANDYEDALPRAGGPSSRWTGRVANWAALSRLEAYGQSADRSGGQVSVSASLYLLVKYADVAPKAFLCGSGETRERGVTEFKARTYRVPNQAAQLTDFWDFGPNPPRHCSYAYHMVYGPSTSNTSSPRGFAVAGDRNPWIDAPSAKAKDFSIFKPDIPPFGGTSDQARWGNTFRHQGEGQNVLFLDSHVEFANRPYCGLEDDNIYTISGHQTVGDPLGTPPVLGSQPVNRKDSLLVNDPPAPRE